MLEQVDQLLTHNPQYQQQHHVAGVVWDSAPCYMSPLVGATAIGHGMAWPLRVLGALAFLLSILLMLPFAPRRPRDYWWVGQHRAGQRKQSCCPAAGHAQLQAMPCRWAPAPRSDADTN